jgi:hypothetical protein
MLKAMETNYFKGCKTINEIKKVYKDLAMKHHPDRGGSTETMQAINAEYSFTIRYPFFNFYDQSEEAKTDFFQFPEVIAKVISFDVQIELCGNWLWISGNTYKYRKELKAAGFFFAPEKCMWYFRPLEFKSSNRTAKSMDYIRARFGSDIVQPNIAKSLQGEEATV